MKYLIMLIIVTTIILLLPYKKIDFLKKILPSFTIALSITLAINGIILATKFLMPTTPVTIHALNQRNLNSEGSEVIIKGIVIDDKWYKPTEIFRGGSSNWIEKDNGSLVWRNYNSPENMSSRIIGNLPIGSKREIIFESNRWRGKAEIILGEDIQNVDFYENSSESKNFVVQVRPSSNEEIHDYKIYKNLINMVVLVIVFFICMLLFKYGAEKQDYFINQDYEIWIDILKLISIFAIIIIHMSGNIYSLNFNKNTSVWYNALYLNSFTRFSVPCFLMISGVFILSKNYSINNIFMKKLPHLIIPLFFWSIFYILINRYVYGNKANLLVEVATIPFKHKFSHLWYVYQLIAWYLIAPILVIIYNNTSKNLRIYFIAITLIIPSFMDMIARLSGNNYNVLNIGWNNLGISEIGLCILGKTLYDEFKEMEIKRWIILCGVFIGSSGIILCSYYKSLKINSPTFEFFEHLRFPDLIFGISVFLLFYSYKSKFQSISNKLKVFVYKISKLIMGVYFVHEIIILVINKYIAPIKMLNSGVSVLEILLKGMICLNLSFMICYIISKIPYLNKLV